MTHAAIKRTSENHMVWKGGEKIRRPIGANAATLFGEALLAEPALAHAPSAADGGNGVISARSLPRLDDP